jgi:hypothetical protein
MRDEWGSLTGQGSGASAPDDRFATNAIASVGLDETPEMDEEEA